MNNKHKLNRRSFLHMSAIAAGGVVLAACGGITKQSNNGATRTTGNSNTPQQMDLQAPPTEAATPAQSTEGTGGGSIAVTTQGTGGEMTAVATQGPASTLPVPQTFKEAPKLTEQVSSGKLPKLAERMPKSPMVLQPVEKIGKYGGTWQGVVGPPTWDVPDTQMGYDYLLRWKQDARAFTSDDVIPNVAESFEVAKDGAEYTLKLRERMKWSDGQPFGADDIMFWYEDVLSNKDLTPAFPDWLKADDKPVKVKKQDDYTVTFKFAKPNGLFLLSLASWDGRKAVSYPRHYMKQFHKKYNPKASQEAQKQQMDNWMNLFGSKADLLHNKDLPVLNGWTITQPLGGDTQQIIFERNPYYWKVDPEGNQLPYIDRVVYNLVEKTDVALLKALNGEADLMVQSNANRLLKNKPIFYKNREKGNYHLIKEIPGKMNIGVISLNLTTRDKNKHKVFNDKNFRIGLSHAMNRQEIIDIVLQGQGQPWQAAPRPESPFKNEKLAKQYTEYDVKKANEYLDKALPKKSSKGQRLGPDGKPFSFQVEMSSENPIWSDVLEQVKRQWAEVGIDMRPKAESRDLLYTRKAGNEVDAVIWTGGGGMTILVDPRYYFPFSGESNYAIPWAYWFANPKNEKAIKPPAAARKQMQLYRQIQATADPKKQVELMNRILDIATEQFWCIGTALQTQGYGIVKNDFHNVPGTILDSWQYQYAGPSNPPQFFKES